MNESLSRPWSHSVVLSMEPLDWESSALTTRQDPQFNLEKRDNPSILNSDFSSRIDPSFSHQRHPCYYTGQTKQVEFFQR